ncbi:MAG: purine-nucleoside phosphorylase [Eggerthellaceae bacterium]|nr:purine-nucleoside phosphorylase [Eggerthellaceae bacterium]
MPSQNILEEHLRESVQVLKVCILDRRPRIGLVLGSGLNGLASEVRDGIKVPFANVPYMKRSTAASHVGQFVSGSLAGKEVLCMQGRLHGYEGNSSQEVAYPIWLMARMGVETLILTNASGAINEGYAPGDFCVIADHINFTGRNPIAAFEPAGLSERFFSMTDAYDPGLRSLALRVAADEGVKAHEGVYLGLLGPSFETPAEIRAFRSWGADAVGMSTVEEAIAARHVGVRVLGISLITNMAAGVKGASPSGSEVLDIAATRADEFCRLMKGILAQLP